MTQLRPRTLMLDALIGFGFGLLVAVSVGWVASSSTGDPQLQATQ